MEVNRRGIQAVEEVLKEARRLARGLPPEKREAIEQMCTEIEALMKELAELQAKGQVSRPIGDTPLVSLASYSTQIGPTHVFMLHIEKACIAWRVQARLSLFVGMHTLAWVSLETELANDIKRWQ